MWVCVCKPWSGENTRQQNTKQKTKVELIELVTLKLLNHLSMSSITSHFFSKQNELPIFSWKIGPWKTYNADSASRSHKYEVLRVWGKVEQHFQRYGFWKMVMFLQLTMATFSAKINLIYTHVRYIQKKCHKGKKKTNTRVMEIPPWGSKLGPGTRNIPKLAQSQVEHYCKSIFACPFKFCKPP